MAIAFVQQKSTWPTSSATSTAQTFTVTAGNFMFIAVSWNNASVTCTVSDNQGNTWNSLGGPQTGAGSLSAFRLQLFYAKNIAGGSTTVTATFSAAVSRRGIALHEYSGVDTTNPIDGGGSASYRNYGTDSHPVSNALTASQTGCCGVLATIYGNGYSSADAGYTLRCNSSFGDNSTIDQVYASSGSKTAGTQAQGTDDNILGFVLLAPVNTGQTITIPAVSATADAVAPGRTITATTPVGAATGDSVAPGVALLLDFQGDVTDANLGQTAVRANADDPGIPIVLATKFTPSAAGTINSGFVYLDGAGPGTGDEDVKMVVYSDESADTTPETLLGESNVVTVTDGQAAGWVEFTFSTPVVLSNTNPIWIGTYNEGVDTIQLRRAAGGGPSHFVSAGISWPTTPTTWDDANTDTPSQEDYSYYVVIESGSGTAVVGIATAEAIAPTVDTVIGGVIIVPVGAATADAGTPSLAVAFTAPASAATADAIEPVLAWPLVIPPGVSTADAAASLVGVAFAAPVGASTADAGAPTVDIAYILASPVGVATADAVAAAVAVAIASPAGTATADAVAPTFLQRLITIISVVITQPRALGSALYERLLSYEVTQASTLGSTIHQRILAPVITAARSVGSAIFRH